jgi:RHS repeat-associated protein
MRSGVSIGCTAASVVTEPLSATATVQNQLGGNGMTYDAAGNVTNDGNGNITYDDENRIATIAGYTYSYDADGMRMEKTNGSSGTMYWFGPGGEVLTETDLTGTVINEEYFFFNGQRIARIDRATGVLHYYFSDQLQSTSVITDSTGDGQAVYYYYPFGGLAYSSGSDPNHYKFTGKERDGESGLDNFDFRYYASSLGRFMKPDEPFLWSESDPQSLNLYGYVSNNPLSRIDPDGHDCVYLNDAGNGVEGVDQSSSSGECGGSGGYWVNGAVTNAQISDTSITLTGTTNGEDNDTSATYSTNSDMSQSPEEHTMWYYMFHGASLTGPAKCDSACFTAWMQFHETTSLLGGVYTGIAVGEMAKGVNSAVDLDNLSNKIANQMVERGWTKDDILDTIRQAQEGGTTYPVPDNYTGGAATEYVGADGKFVVVNNASGNVIQVSGPGFRPNYLVK